VKAPELVEAERGEPPRAPRTELPVRGEEKAPFGRHVEQPGEERPQAGDGRGRKLEKRRPLGFAGAMLSSSYAKKAPVVVSANSGLPRW